MGYKTFQEPKTIKGGVMTYEQFRTILDDEIFEKSKADLLKKIADYPYRYIGLFRPTKPKAKILQNLLQSNEIRFGDALEFVIGKYFEEFGYEPLEKKLVTEQGEQLCIDQYFKKDNKIIFVEQKVRDDHDSTKKRGQIINFEKKLAEIIKVNSNLPITGFFYFIDSELKKNKNYYGPEIIKIRQDYGVELYLMYGKEFFEHFEIESVWNEIISYLKRWKENIPELPTTNFDLNYQESFEEIKNLEPIYYRRIFGNEDIKTDILPIIFPEGRVLNLLKDYFEEKSDIKIYSTLFENLREYLQATSSRNI